MCNLSNIKDCPPRKIYVLIRMCYMTKDDNYQNFQNDPRV